MKKRKTNKLARKKNNAEKTDSNLKESTLEVEDYLIEDEQSINISRNDAVEKSMDDVNESIADADCDHNDEIVDSDVNKHNDDMVDQLVKLLTLKLSERFQVKPQQEIMEVKTVKPSIANADFAKEFAEALKSSEKQKKLLPMLYNNSSKTDFDTWNEALVFAEKEGKIEPHDVEIMKQSLNFGLQQTLIAIHGAKKYYNSKRDELIEMLTQLMIPKMNALTKTIDIDKCRQKIKESVKDYFCRKSRIITAAFPDIQEESKITFIHEGLKQEIKKKVPFYTRFDEKMTMSRYLHILCEIENTLDRSNFSERKPSQDFQNHRETKFPFPQKNWKFEKKENQNSEESKKTEIKNNDKVKPSVQERNQASNAKISCAKCGKTNHQIENCFQNKPNFKPNVYSRACGKENFMVAEIIINGVKLNAIIDSGAEMSIMKKSCAQDCQLKMMPLTLNLVASNNSRCKLDNYIMAKFKFFGLHLKQKFALMEDLNADALLGLDFFKKKKLTIDAFNRCLWHRTSKDQMIKFDLTKESDETEVQHKIPFDWHKRQKNYTVNKDEMSLNVITSTSKIRKKDVMKLNEVSENFECGFKVDETTTLKANSRTWVPVLCSFQGNIDVILQPLVSLLIRYMIRIPAGLCSSQTKHVIVTNLSDHDQIIEKDVMLATGVLPSEIRDFKAHLSGKKDIIVEFDEENTIKINTVLKIRNDADNITESTTKKEDHFNIGPQLNQKDKQDIIEILDEFKDRFAYDHKDLEGSELKAMKIDLIEGTEAVKGNPYRQPGHLKKIIEEQIEEMLHAGIIQPSESSWASPVILVKKKDGKWRFCVDYRKLNAATKGLSYPLPHIDSTLDTLSGAKVFKDTRSQLWILANQNR